MLAALSDTIKTTLPQVTITQNGTSANVPFSTLQGGGNSPRRASFLSTPSAPLGTSIVHAPQQSWACERGSK